MTSEQTQTFMGTLDNKEYYLDKLIGRGGTSEVYLSTVQKEQPNRKLAIKILMEQRRFEKYFKAEELSMNNLKRLLPQEATEEEKEILFKNICIPREVKTGVLALKGRPKRTVNYIVLDYASKKDFYDFVQTKTKSGFEEKYVRAIFKKMLNALQVCHSANICHRDIKLENFIVDEHYNIKLCDFGFADEFKEINPENHLLSIKVLTENLGTKTYKAPELLYNTVKYDGSKIDIFSLGVVLFAMKFCLFPFSKANGTSETYKAIIVKNYNNYWRLLKKTAIENNQEFNEPSDEFKDLFQRMVAVNPLDRPDINEILKHPWLQLECASDEELSNELSLRERE